MSGSSYCSQYDDQNSSDRETSSGSLLVARGRLNPSFASGDSSRFASPEREISAARYRRRSFDRCSSASARSRRRLESRPLFTSLSWSSGVTGTGCIPRDDGALVSLRGRLACASAVQTTVEGHLETNAAHLPLCTVGTRSCYTGAKPDSTRSTAGPLEPLPPGKQGLTFRAGVAPRRAESAHALPRKNKEEKNCARASLAVSTATTATTRAHNPALSSLTRLRAQVPTLGRSQCRASVRRGCGYRTLSVFLRAICSLGPIPQKRPVQGVLCAMWPAA